MSMETLVKTLSSLSEVPAEYLIQPSAEQLAILGRMVSGLSDEYVVDQQTGEVTYTPAGFPPNPEQAIFFEHLIGTRYNLGLNAKAGTGKTTTIEAAVRLLLPQIDAGKKVLFLAFNRSIAGELRQRFTEKSYKVDVATVHSQGLRSLKFALSQKAKAKGMSAQEFRKLDLIDLEANKFRNFVRTSFQTAYQDEEGTDRWNYSELEEKFGDLEEFEPQTYVRSITQIADYARMYLTSKTEGLKQIVKRYGIEIQADEVAQAQRLLKFYTKAFFNYDPSSREPIAIDYSDMLWLPNVGAAGYNWKFKQYDYVFVDEAQDLSKAQRTLVQKFVKASGRLIFVGDPNQAIYGFAGADSDSYEALTKIPNTKVLPLNRCYRCGSNIIKIANQFVPDIVADKSTGRGETRQGAFAELKRGDIVIGRNTAPLVSVCMFLIRNKINATVLGSNISEGLISALKSTRAKDVDTALDKLWTKYDCIVDRLVATNKADDVEDASTHPTAVLLEDKIETLTVIAEQSGAMKVRSLITEIKKIFSEKVAAVTCMTAHKSKGLEATNVFILDWEEAFPSPFATSKEDRQQEDNLQYVAVTRAKKKLLFVDTPEHWGDTEAPKIR